MKLTSAKVLALKPCAPYNAERVDELLEMGLSAALRQIPRSYANWHAAEIQRKLPRARVSVQLV